MTEKLSPLWVKTALVIARDRKAMVIDADREMKKASIRYLFEAKKNHKFDTTELEEALRYGVVAVDRIENIKRLLFRAALVLIDGTDRLG